uniref:Olfactory receptor n=1 Tax=Sphaeramia orbicularis TaxID=375764 RepID=A0A673AXF1_9TELE
MENSTEITSFLLTAYGNIGSLKYLYFILMLVWYFSIFVTNAFVITVIYLDRRLHEPMYIFLCNLFVSEIGGSTSLYPLLISQMFSDTHEVTIPWCFLQMFLIYTCTSAEFYSLAAMAYDRYIAICYPLHYSVILTTDKAAVVILFIWLCSLTCCIIMFSLMVHVEYCGNAIDKVFCDYHLVVKLACSVSVINSISDLLYSCVSILLPVSFISVSYLKILQVCQKASQENKQKAITTCTPQMVSVSNLFLGCIFHFADSRFDKTHVLDKVRIILSVYLLVFQPMISPFLYGFNLPKIRESCKRFLFSRK